MTHAKVPELTDTGCRVVNDSPDGKMLNPEFPLAGGLFTCAFCGQSMTGERIRRKLKGGGIREHIYYRCANNSPGPDHPTVRWKSHEREQAIVEDLHQLRLPTPEIAEWFRTTLEESLADLLSHQHRRAATLAKRKSELMAMKDRLLNANLAGTVDDDAFKAKTAELKADTARVTEEIDAQGDVDPTRGKAVLAVFDWSQKVAEIWRGSNTAARLFRRTARFEEKSGIQDLNLRPLGPPDTF